MLILSRKEGEKIIIGKDVSVIVLGTSGKNVRLGINAPKKIPVHREEIHKKILKEKSETKK